ncbi:hypothetical protein [Marinobacterium sp. MBR-109]|uniref:hypothetical protein n=1 Tax=Marinobacterium sp. MBR-109 TaxID=3156462 RepID=UPI00339687D9
MESKSRRPTLLSRGQLRLLIWVLPVVILLLSLLGPESQPEAVISADSDRRIYQQVIPQQSLFRLHLIAPHPPALDASIQLRQRLITQAWIMRLQKTDELGDWLSAQGWEVQVQANTGYRLLQLKSDRPFADNDVRQLLLQLQTPPRVDWSALLQRTQAEQYMMRQNAEVWLTSPPSSNEHPSLDPLADYARQLQPSGWRITLTGPEPQSLGPVIFDPAPSPAPSENLMLSLKPLPVTPTADAQLQLHRWTLPQVHSAQDFAQLLLGRELVVQPLSHWLKQRLADAPAHQTGYSLRWEATQGGGLASLLLQGEQWPEIPAWLPQQLQPENVETARQALLTQLEGDTGRQQWMDLLALYQLPPDSLQRLPAQLEALELSAMQQWLQSQLLSDYYHTLSLPH